MQLLCSLSSDTSDITLWRQELITVIRCIIFERLHFELYGSNGYAKNIIRRGEV